jgi:uncharacterized protein
MAEQASNGPAADEPTANEQAADEQAAADRARPPLAEAIAAAHVNAPTRGNRKLESLLEAANGDDQLKAWWHVAQVNAERLGMSDHSWVHVQVVNIALRILRLLERRGVQPCMVSDHGMGERDAEVVVAAAAMLHDTGMSIHRTDHESFSLFLAARKLDELLAACYREPARSVVAAEALHAIIAHRRRGDPLTIEAGIVRVADALDMAEGGSRSRAAAPTSTPCPRPRSSACASSPAPSAPCRSRSR